MNSSSIASLLAAIELELSEPVTSSLVREGSEERKVRERTRKALAFLLSKRDSSSSLVHLNFLSFSPHLFNLKTGRLLPRNKTRGRAGPGDD
jgi:hypothetical protein